MSQQRSDSLESNPLVGDPQRRRQFLCRLVLTGAGSLGSIRGAAAEPPLTGSDPGSTNRIPESPLSISPEQARESFQWLASLAAKQIPPVFEGDKGWGETKRIWAGVKLDLDGHKLTTHRRYRDLRHGRWSRYQLTPSHLTRDPENAASSGLQIVIDEVQSLQDGRWRVRSTIRAPIHFETRIERWNLGVQWYSIQVGGELRVRVEATATVGFIADYSDIPPALIIDPEIDRARLILETFEVRRISKLGRDIAGNLGDIAQSLIEETWLKKENDRLVTRINTKIDRRRDDLRWSLWDFLQGPAPSVPPAP